MPCEPRNASRHKFICIHITRVCTLVRLYAKCYHHCINCRFVTTRASSGKPVNSAQLCYICTNNVQWTKWK